MKYKQFSVLVVDDNPADAELLRLALAEAGVTDGLVAFQKGADVLAYLQREDIRCDLLLLDLNLPQLSGFDILEQIRKSERWTGLPVIVMSGSNNPQDFARSSALGANSYICKPVHLPEILESGRLIVSYLLNGMPAVRSAAAAVNPPVSP